MFRQRGSGYARRARQNRARQRGATHSRSWRIWLAALAGCGAAVLAVHVATASRTLHAVSSSDVARIMSGGPHGGRSADHGYGRGGYPIMPHTSRAAAATTMNWAGYAEAGAPGTFTSVSAFWVQPAVTCGAADTFSSFWAGLDGAGTPTVEQTGTEADCSGGKAVYAGWYEIFPNAPVFYDEPLQPGDAMSAAVVSGGGGSFTLTLSDTTEHWTRTTDQRVPAAELGSAEVIAEAPSGQEVLPLADFGTVDFTGVTVNGQPVGGGTPIALTLVSGAGAAEATPSALNGQGGFSVTWDTSGGISATATTGTQGTGRHHRHRDHGQG